MPTSAKQLHDLLALVRAQDDLTVGEAWAEVLGADYGSVEFASLHAQVVSLLDETALAIRALRESSRDRLAPHVKAWWEAVVMPAGSWTASRTLARDIISTTELESLASAADLIEAQLDGTDFATHLLLEDVDQVCVDWLRLLPEAGLPPEYERALAAQIEHLRWIVSHASLFGVSAIAREAQRTLGSLTAATEEVSDQNARGPWKRGCAALALAITSWTGAATLTHQAIESTTTVIEDVVEIIEQVQHGDVQTPDDSPESEDPN